MNLIFLKFKLQPTTIYEKYFYIKLSMAFLWLKWSLNLNLDNKTTGPLKVISASCKNTDPTRTPVWALTQVATREQ